MKEFINTLDLYFGKKAPQLPKAAKEWIVKFAPYLSIIGIVIMIPAALALIGLSSIFGNFYHGYYYDSRLGIISIISVVLYAIAIPGLFKKNASGWDFMFYATIVSSVSQLFFANIINAIISIAVGLYFLFQVKPYYFGGAKISEVSALAPTPAENKPSEPESPASENTEQK